MSRSSSARRAPPVGRPPGADGDATRERIIDAALEAFAEHGYEAMSVRELTRELGVSHNLVHHYFGSKSDLWYAAIDHRLGASADEIFLGIEQSIGAAEPEPALRALLELVFQSAAMFPSVLSIIANESHRGGERLDYLYARVLEPGIDLVARFLEAARPHPMCEQDPRFLALHVWSVTTAMAAQNALFKKVGYDASRSDEQLNDYARSTIELLMNGLFRAA